MRLTAKRFIDDYSLLIPVFFAVFIIEFVVTEWVLDHVAATNECVINSIQEEVPPGKDLTLGEAIQKIYSPEREEIYHEILTSTTLLDGRVPTPEEKLRPGTILVIGNRTIELMSGLVRITVHKNYNVWFYPRVVNIKYCSSKQNAEPRSTDSGWLWVVNISVLLFSVFVSFVFYYITFPTRLYVDNEWSLDHDSDIPIGYLVMLYLRIICIGLFVGSIVCDILAYIKFGYVVKYIVLSWKNGYYSVSDLGFVAGLPFLLYFFVSIGPEDDEAETYSDEFIDKLVGNNKKINPHSKIIEI